MAIVSIQNVTCIITVSEIDFIEFDKPRELFDSAINELLENGYTMIKYESKCWDNYKQVHHARALLGVLKK